MANVIIEEQNLVNIANAIRNNYGTIDRYKPSEMAPAINTQTDNIKTSLSSLTTLSTQNPNTNDYITNLESDKTTLKNNLETKGVTGLTNNMTFTELAPKVLETGNPSEYFYQSTTNTNTSNYAGGWAYLIKKIVGVEPQPNGNCEGLFYRFNGTEIDLSNFRNKYVYKCSSMFAKCVNLESLDITPLGSIGNSTSSTNTSPYAMFNECTNLKTLNMNVDLGYIYASNQNNCFYVAFNLCSNLENLTFGYNYGKSFSSNITYAGIDFSSCSKLTHDSIMSIFNGLYDITSKGYANGPVIKFHADALARVSASEIQIATDKGWRIQ